MERFEINLQNKVKMRGLTAYWDKPQNGVQRIYTNIQRLYWDTCELCVYIYDHMYIISYYIIFILMYIYILDIIKLYFYNIDIMNNMFMVNFPWRTKSSRHHQQAKPRRLNGNGSWVDPLRASALEMPVVCGAKSRGFLEIVHQTNPLKFARLFLVSFLPRSPYMIHMGTPYLEQIQYETKVSKGFLKSRGRGLVSIYIY